MASGYVKPVQGTIKRLDQGIDFQGKPGGSVVAIGLARVDYVKDDPNGFGKAIYYTLLSGPMRGQQIYVCHTQPNVTQGQILQAGDRVSTLLASGGGNASSLAGWTEIGFAKNGAPEGRGSARRFQKFINNLPYSTSTPTAQPQPPATEQQQQPLPSAPQADYAVQQVEPPSPETTQPQVLSPGTADSASLWQKVTGLGGVSADTQAYAQNVLTAAGG